MRTYEEPEFVWETEQIMNMNTEIGERARLRVIIDSIKNLHAELEVLKMDLYSIKNRKGRKTKNGKTN